MSFVTFVWRKGQSADFLAHEGVDDDATRRSGLTGGLFLVKLFGVFFRLARATLILAVCLSVGGHWAALQSAAWATMIVQYSQNVSLVEAVTQTFDGGHPCGLCKGIATAQHSQKKSNVQSVTIKPDLICATRTIALLPRSTDFPFGRLEMSVPALAHSPPTPPPRSELA